MTPPPVYAFDLETTALDPNAGKIVAASVFGPGVAFSHADPGYETGVLDAFNETLYDLPVDARLTTWNGWGFDLNWLRTRQAALDVVSPLSFRETTETSKYGSPLLRATFRGHDVGDVYYQTCWPTWAVRQGLPSTGLKAVAQAALGVTPHDIDVTRLSDYTDEQIAGYGLDDSRWTWTLWELRSLAAA